MRRATEYKGNRVTENKEHGNYHNIGGVDYIGEWKRKWELLHIYIYLGIEGGVDKAIEKQTEMTSEGVGSLYWKI